MGCSGRPKEADIKPEQKWDFISLNDFKSTSCFTPFAYGYLFVSLTISIAVYAVDTFTAVNLLAFNRWSGEISPKIPLNISKWIFSACIIASWVNLGFEYVRAIRVMKRGAVAESYLDSLAVRLQCVRFGQEGRGWRRFLVFAELTKSKKGVEYVALFTFFSFQSWIRVIFCQGPRQVVNAVTLYSVYNTELAAQGSNVGSTLLNFFKKIGILAEENHQQAVILSGMVFTLVIWIFAVLSLMLAVLFYLLFLWHYIPNRDGGLSGYCERKINGRLSKIVSVKVNKAIEEEERKRQKEDAKAARNGEKPKFGRTATLPTLFDSKDEEDKLPEMPMLSRNDTMATLPVYSSRPTTPGQPTLPAFELDELNQRPPYARNVTNASNLSISSVNSNAPLMSNAGEMGYGRSSSPAPSLTPTESNPFPPPQRTMTGNPNYGQGQRGPGPQIPRMPSAMADRGYTQSPASYGEARSPPFANPRSPIRQGTVDSYSHPLRPTDNFNRSNTPSGPAPSMGRRTPFDPTQGRSSPAPQEYGRSSPAPTYHTNPPTPAPATYQAFNPDRRPAPIPQSTRNMTDPGLRSPPNDYFPPMPPQRSATGMGMQQRGSGDGAAGEWGPRMGTPTGDRGPPIGYNGSAGNQGLGSYRR